ncbi:MAG: MarR family transcriptional regulator [Crocinitomicaceae bacterium]
MDDQQLLLGNQICFPLYSVSRLITKAYTPYLKKMGLTYPQYLVMMVLWEKDAVSVNQIVEQLMLDTNTLSPLLKRMEKMELIKRNRSTEDERCVHIGLTQKGRELKKTAVPIPEQLLQNLLTENIELEEIIHLKEVLNTWIDALAKKQTTIK